MSDIAERVLLPSAVVPVHYNLELTPDLEAFTFLGHEVVDVVVSAATDKITVHAKHLKILNAAVFEPADGSAKLESFEISYNSRLSTVSFTFPSNLPLGNGKLSVAFSGELNNQMAGFYRSKYYDIDGTELYMATTQFESLDARRCFPCWDEPARKATFSATLVVKSHLCALSNMPETSSTYLKNGMKRVVFDKTPIMSTYLLAFCVGKFDYLTTVTKHGVAMRVFTPPGMADKGEFALRVGREALDFYDDYFQIPYPLPKLDQIVVTEFAAGAMENWGLVTYRENALLIDEHKSDVVMKQRVALVICHELAHQWFGNLVTMTWWCDLWLNEGFASWMQHEAVNHLFPEWKIWEQYTTDTIGMAQKLDSLRSSHPIQVPIKHAEEVEEVFDHISYAKGSTVVRMNECVLGQQKFREGLQVYLGRHKYSNTETTDLWRAWSEVSGVDINALMASWTSKMGYPYLKVLAEEWKENECVLKLQQTWFLADGSGEKETETWSVPISISSSADPRHGVQSTGMSAEDIATEKVFERRIAFPTGSAEGQHWVKLNSGQVALLRVAHSENMLKRMLIPGIRDKGLSAIDRAAVLDDQYCLAMAGLARTDLVAMLLSAYGEEDNATVWKCLHPILLALLSAMDTAVQLRNDEASAVAALNAFKQFAKTRIILPALDRFGWEARAGESDVRKLTRGSIFGLVEEFCYDEPEIKQRCADLFRQSVNATIADPASDTLAGDIKASVYRIALRNGGEDEYALLMLLFRSTTTDAVRKWVTSTLGSASTKQMKQRVMDWSISGDVKLQDCFYPMTSVANSSREGVEVAWNYLKDNFARIKGMTATANAWSMQYIIAACASRLSTKAQAADMEAFFQANPVPTASRKISQVLEKIHVTANFAESVSRGDLMTAAFWEKL